MKNNEGTMNQKTKALIAPSQSVAASCSLIAGADAKSENCTSLGSQRVHLQLGQKQSQRTDT